MAKAIYDVQVPNIGEVERALGDMRDKAPRAMKNAVNQTATRAKNMMIRQARLRYAVNSAGRRHLNALKVRNRATTQNPTAEIFISSRRNDLGDFQSNPSVPHMGRDWVFNFGYTVTDADGDTLTVTEKLDGKTTATRTGVASGTALTFGQGSTAENFQRILNGSHTIQITANDGKESTSLSATFTKSVTSASVTLTTPLAVDGDITVAVLQVTGSIPDDAVFKAEVTNNANDPSPVWQDVTTEVQKGTNIVFSNKTAANGAAFNFRISVARGASGTGGYIEAISGAFQ